VVVSSHSCSDSADSSGIVIRSATAADAPALASLAGELTYPSTPEDIYGRLAAIGANPEHCVLVAEIPVGTIAGMIDLFVLRTMEADARAEVAGLVVAAASRSAGVGRALLERGERWARTMGCRRVTLRSNVIRERAHAFYLREGYTHIKTQKAFRKELAPDAAEAEPATRVRQK
jgi:GNAT superfamily N-acetyltransferase